MGLLLLQQLRRDRLTLPIWILGTALLLTVSAASVVSEYGDAEGRESILTVALATPALLALRGIPNGDSLGSAVHFQSFAFLAVTIGLMNVFLATRHGRADEEKGRRELVAATPVGRLAAPAATLVLGLIANGVFVVLGTLGYLSAGLDVERCRSQRHRARGDRARLPRAHACSWASSSRPRAPRTASARSSCSARTRSARPATPSAPPTSRSSRSTPAWPSALSPIGWGQQTLAFTEDRWWPVLALAALAVVATAVALVVHSRRELGASLLPERLGRPTGSPALGSTLGLAWRLQTPTLIAWTAGSALLGLLLGSLVTAVGTRTSRRTRSSQAVLQSLGHTDQSGRRERAHPDAHGLRRSARRRGGRAGRAPRPRGGVGRARRDGRWRRRCRARAGSAPSRSSPSSRCSSCSSRPGLASAIGFAAIGQHRRRVALVGQALVQAPAALVFVALAVLAGRAAAARGHRARRGGCSASAS